MKIAIGSRESKLAVVQSEMVRAHIQQALPTAQVDILTMKTTGDIILDRSLDKVGGKGLFVKELDHALLDGRSDLSVHSLKDMPMEVPEELPLLGFSCREDARDALIYPAGCDFWDMNKPLGCSSKRRIVQLQKMYPNVEVKLIRGNVQTRLRKLDEGEYGAIILAAAGLHRLDLTHRISRYFAPTEMLPAAGQGILAVQGKMGQDYTYLNSYFHAETTVCALAERAFVRTLDGGCSSPIAAYAQVDGNTVTLTGLYCTEDDSNYIKQTITGDCAQAETLGMQLAHQIKEAYHAK